MVNLQSTPITNTLAVREEHVKELESALISRLYEIFSSIRLIKSFAREPYETERYARSGIVTRDARIAVTWQQSLFGVAVGAIVGALTIGKAGPYLLSALPRMDVRAITVTSSLSALAAAVLVMLLVGALRESAS